MPEYAVRIQFVEPLLGTVPLDREVYAAKVLSQASEEIEEEMDTVVDRPPLSGFHRDENGPFLYDYAIMGFLKEAGNAMKDIVGVKALRSKLERLVVVHPRRIRLPEPAGVLTRSLRAQTMRGERMAIVSSEYIEAGAILEFTLDVLPNKEVTREVLEQVLAYGRRVGLGQWRSGGYGRFEVVYFA